MIISTFNRVRGQAVTFFSRVSAALESRISNIVKRQLYSGYVRFDPKKAEQITRSITNTFDAFPILCEGVDILYIPSKHPDKKNSVMVIADTTTYEERAEKGTLPHKWNHFLNLGMDLVLFNPRDPREVGNQGYADDLIRVIRALKKRDLSQQICIKAYCATGEPVIAAVAEFNHPSISMILDRTYADLFPLARSFTFLAKIPLIRRVIENQSVGAQAKIQTLALSKILFIAPKDPRGDQVLYWKGENLTYRIYNARKQAGYRDPLIELGPHTDHWSIWNKEEYRQVDEVLCRWGLATSTPHTSAPYSDREPLSLFKTRCAPCLIHTC